MSGRAKELMLYLTRKDADEIRVWINSEKDVAWILKCAQSGKHYRWRAVDEISVLSQSKYALWHKTVTIAARVNNQEAPVPDPYQGWSQDLESENYEAPWVANIPDLYSFTFKEAGTEKPNSIGRSGFHWLGDYFRAIGKGASEPSKQWWARLHAFVKKNATAVPWPPQDQHSRFKAYAFPDAYSEISRGRHADANP